MQTNNPRLLPHADNCRQTCHGVVFSHHQHQLFQGLEILLVRGILLRMHQFVNCPRILRREDRTDTNAPSWPLTWTKTWRACASIQGRVIMTDSLPPHVQSPPPPANSISRAMQGPLASIRPRSFYHNPRGAISGNSELPPSRPRIQAYCSVVAFLLVLLPCMADSSEVLCRHETELCLTSVLVDGQPACPDCAGRARKCPLEVVCSGLAGQGFE